MLVFWEANKEVPEDPHPTCPSWKERYPQATWHPRAALKGKKCRPNAERWRDSPGKMGLQEELLIEGEPTGPGDLGIPPQGWGDTERVTK